MDFENNIPIYVQVINDIKNEIVTGQLKLGDKLPSARDLALKYQINPNTSARIYKELEALELCFTRRGLGTFVTEDSDKMMQLKKEMANNLLETFIVGMKNLDFSKEELLELLEANYDN